MMMRMPLLTLVLACMPAYGEEPSEEALREEASRTILRRFSKTEKAQTAKIGLSRKATAFLDLYLDLARNRDAIRRGSAPRSKQFHGTPHPMMEIVKGRLRYRACFATFTIDEVEIPLNEVASVVAAALDEEKFRAASIPSDGADRLNRWRLILISDLVALCDAELSGPGKAGRGWQKARERVAEKFLAELGTSPNQLRHAILRCLAKVGDDAVAKALIAKFERLPGDSPPWMKSAYVHAICATQGKTAQEFLKTVLSDEEGDDALKIAALSAVQRAPPEETFALIEGMIAPNSEYFARVRSAAISAIERTGGKKAVAVLEKAFKQRRSEKEKYKIACALTRMGSPAAVPYLKEVLEELEGNNDIPSKIKVSAIQRALEEFEKKQREARGD